MNEYVSVGNGCVSFYIGQDIEYKIRDTTPYTWLNIKTFIDSGVEKIVINNQPSIVACKTVRCYKDRIVFDFIHSVISVPMHVAQRMCSSVLDLQ